MPKKAEKNLQLMTWKEASEVIKRLVKFGISVSNICEISNESGRINVATLLPISGTGQSANINTPFANPLVVSARELSGLLLAVSDESWFDDEQPHQYVATVWGLEQNLSLVGKMLDGTFNGLSRLAVASFPSESTTLTYTKALSAITDLPGIREGLNSICSKLNTL